MIDVSIIIVNYKCESLTLNAVKSINEKSHDFSYEIIIVDNSNNLENYNNLSNLLEPFPDVKIINANGNLGFGRANNLGSKHSKGHYLYFLNSDTLLINNAIYELFAFIKNHNDVGIVGSNLYTKDNLPNHSFFRFEKNIKNEKKAVSLVNAVKTKLTKKRNDFNYSNSPLDIRGYVCGASLMVSKEDFDKIGGFDNDIFLYAEESLLCYRISHDLNKRIMNVPSSKIIHFEGGSFENTSSNHLANYLDGNAVYYRKIFSQKTVIKYIKANIRSTKNKQFIAMILRDKRRQAKYANDLIVYYKKLSEETKKMDSLVVVTGVKGQLGFDCVNELKKQGYKKIIGIDKDELDITNEKAVDLFFEEHKPNVLIHCAAWTAVDKAEQFKDEVFKVNALGPKYLAKNCKRFNTKMVYISTDYVFDGKGDKPFETNSPKKGLSIYGESKSKGEDYVQENTDKYFIVRTTGVFGINGNNFIKTMLKLADSGKTELNIVDDQIVSVTYTKDLAVLLCDMIKTDKYGIYHATNEGFISWADFAKEIFKQANKEVTVNYVSSEDYKKIVPSQADRPLNSRLSKASLDSAGFKRLPSYKDALKRYLNELNTK